MARFEVRCTEQDIRQLCDVLMAMPNASDDAKRYVVDMFIKLHFVHCAELKDSVPHKVGGWVLDDEVFGYTE